MKKILIIFLAIALVSCRESTCEHIRVEKPVIVDLEKTCSNYKLGIETICEFEYKGCQYITIGYKKLTHRGDCNSPIHRKR